MARAIRSYRLPPPSEEQSRVMELSTQPATHIIVRACAGSGKTTTTLHIARVNPGRRILLLTYNAKLKFETRKRVEDLGIENMEVHTYHSFAVRYGSKEAYKDEGLLRYVHRPDAFRDAPSYPIMIMDEVQDMNPLYYTMALHLATRKTDGISLIFLGDPLQSIYGFNRADARFLLLAESIFPVPGSWRTASLTTTYRLTHSMARFVDTCCEGVPPIHAVRDGRPVEYMIMNSYKGDVLCEKIRLHVRQRGNGPEDIFVLAPSIKSARSPVRNLANTLTRKGFPIYVPTSDEERLDPDVIQKKIVFSTFHQVKGLERKFVIVYNFDESYLTFYGDGNMTTIPNPLYVAITRASERLIVVHDEKNRFLPCVHPDTIRQCTDMTIPPGWSQDSIMTSDTTEKSSGIRDRAVTELIRHLPVDIVAECRGLLHTRAIRLASMKEENPIELDIPVKTRQAELYENVGEITGTCIPSLFEWSITGKISFVDHIANDTMQKLSNHRRRGNRLLLRGADETPQGIMDTGTLYRKMSQGDDLHTVHVLLRYATRWCSQKSGYHFKESQIKTFDWVSMDDLRTVNQRLQNMFPARVRPGLRFEFPLVVTRENDRLRIIGFADLIDTENGVLCEMKAVKQVDTEHLLQLAIYLYMTRQLAEIPRIRKSILVNLLDGRVWQIEPSDNDLDRIMTIIVSYKNSIMENISNATFISTCTEIQQKIKKL